ncbi:hypothetical protein [Mucilaginibacter boryungensis]|uniref:Uncharacterized protein n=1 Tax=Mucilaginibacter boryungensis TaxID=768480 RepID=A0ABR9XKY9_9SPHI|nr:hypothetical protein [Mucilaginibacter boryungensis]MBE9667633.1 hypothetical protein [Mucilaginibacter boryungensis]
MSGNKKAKTLLKVLAVQFPLVEINFDLEDQKRCFGKGLLICTDAVISLVTAQGYEGEVLEQLNLINPNLA